MLSWFEVWMYKSTIAGEYGEQLVGHVFCVCAYLEWRWPDSSLPAWLRVIPLGSVKHKRCWEVWHPADTATAAEGLMWQFHTQHVHNTTGTSDAAN